MDAFKGVFRRATQSTKEKTGSVEATVDTASIDVNKRIVQFQKTSVVLSEKVRKLEEALLVVGTMCREIGEEYRAMAVGEPGQQPPMYDGVVALSGELAAFGAEVHAKSTEMQKNLREHAFDPMTNFLHDLPLLKSLEEDRRKKQLEHDFFKTKVEGLIKDPPKDFSRIPRNEMIRENWRQQLHQASEGLKIGLSKSYAAGQQAVDGTVYCVAMTMGNWAGAMANGCGRFAQAQLPAYPAQPILVAEQLPPPPPQWVPPVMTYGSQPQQPQQPQQQQQGGAVSQPNLAQQQQSQPGFAPQSNSQSPQQSSSQFGQSPPQQQQQFGQSPQQQQQQQQQQSQEGQQAWGQQQQQQQQVSPSAPAPAPAQGGWGQQPQQQQQQQQPAAAAPAATPWGAPPPAE
jgi:hypothetical protein